MALKDAVEIAAVEDFRKRLKVALARTAINVRAETSNEVQRITVTGSPTNGSFTLASLPGSIVTVQAGTLTNAATSITGMATTVGLFVGMSVTGTNVPAGATLASITSGTAGTLSANASGSGAQTLTFSGTPVASIPWNASAADVQAILSALPTIGVGQVICSGGPLPGTAVDVTFIGNFSSSPQRLITLGTNALTGGSGPTATFSRITPGTNLALKANRSAFASNVLASLDTYVQLMGIGVADDSNVAAFYPGPSFQFSGNDANCDTAINNRVAAVWNAYS